MGLDCGGPCPACPPPDTSDYAEICSDEGFEDEDGDGAANCYDTDCDINAAPCCGTRTQGESTYSTSSGSLSHDQKLFSVSGGSYPARIKLYYNSHSGYDGPLGLGWTHSYDISLTEHANGDVTLRYGENKTNYVLNGSVYESQGLDTATLTEDGGVFTLSYRDGRVWTFDSSGRVTALQDRHDNTLDFAYTDATTTTITDPQGRIVTLNYDGNGRIDTIEDPANSIYDFNYYTAPGKENLLEEVVSPAPTSGATQPTWVYGYDDDGYMNSKTDPEGNLVSYYYYTDTEHRLDYSISPTGETKTLIYDSANNKTTVEEPDEGQWEYHFDANSGVLVKKTSLDETHTTSYAYYADGRKLAKTVPGNQLDGTRYTTVYTYDATNGKLASKTVPQVVAVDVDDPAVFNESTISSLGLTTAISYSYDYASDDRLSSITNHVTGISYSMVWDTDSGYDRLTVSEDDGVNTPLTISATHYNTDTHTDPTGSVHNVTDGNGLVTSYAYYQAADADPEGLLKSITYPSGVSVEYSNYTNLGKPQTIKRIDNNTASPTTHTFTINYDALGRIDDTIGNAPEYTTDYVYDLLGNLESLQDAEDNTTVFENNYKGAVTKITQQVNNETVETILQYGSAGCADCGGNASKLTGVVDANHSADADPLKTSFQYDKRGNLVAEIDQLQQQVAYEYYDSGKLYRKIHDKDGSGDHSAGDIILYTLTWRTDGQIETKTVLDEEDNYQVTTYSYYDNNRLDKVEDTTATPVLYYDYAYHPNGDVHTVTDGSGRVVEYQAYDGVGRPTTMSYNVDGVDAKTLTYVYDAKGLLDTISSEAGTFDFTPDSFARRGNLDYPNGVTATYGYDATTGWLTNVDYEDNLSSPLLSIGYPNHDKVGNRKDRVEDGVTTTYNYDEAYQLLQAKTGPAAENYTYDKVGNRLSGPTVIDIAGESYVHDDANRMMHGRKLTYEYDELGNQTKRIFSNEPGDYAAFEQYWDGEGQLKKVELIRDKGAREILRRTTFKYDPFGRRIEMKVVYRPDTTAKTVITTFVYDREDIIFTLVDDDATEVKTHYIHGLGIDEPLAMVRDGSAYYYHADGLGSIVAITDASQQVVQRYSYESFGRMKASNRSFKNFYTYTGREWNRAIGLYYYRARYYDPMDGRFVSKDPIGFSGGDVNLYRYVGNGPVGWVDPSGLSSLLLGRMPFMPRLLRPLNMFRNPRPPTGYPKPPGWSRDWTWRYPEARPNNARPRWFDPRGGEWRWHPRDRFHREGHWDHNPWDSWNSPWRNLDTNGNPLPSGVLTPHAPCPDDNNSLDDSSELDECVRSGLCV